MTPRKTLEGLDQKLRCRLVKKDLQYKSRTPIDASRELGNVLDMCTKIQLS